MPSVREESWLKCQTIQLGCEINWNSINASQHNWPNRKKGDEFFFSVFQNGTFNEFSLLKLTKSTRADLHEHEKNERI